MPKRFLNPYIEKVNAVRQKLRRNEPMTAEEQVEAAAVLLTGGVMEQIPLQDISTERKARETWENTLAVNRKYAENFAATMSPQEMDQLLRKNDGEASLRLSFQKHVASYNRFPDDLHESLRPSAYRRVVELKERMRRGDFNTFQERRRAMAEVLAARESVNAGRGSALFVNDNLINGTIPSDVSKRADLVEKELENVPEETLNRMYREFQGHTYGGAMQDELEPLRKTAIEREINTLLGRSSFTGAATVRENAAEMIWLLQHQNISDEEFRTVRENGTMRQEIADIKNSMAYDRFVNSMSELELSNMFDDMRAGTQESRNAVLNAYALSSQEAQNQDPWAENLYNKLRTDPQQFAKMSDLMGQICSKEMTDSFNAQNGQLSLIPEVARKLNSSLLKLENKKQFIRCARDFRERLTYIRTTFKSDSWEQFNNEHPAFRELGEIMEYPERRTGADVDLAQKACVGFDSMGNEVERILLERVALYEQLKDKPDWKTAEVDLIKLRERADELTEELSSADGGGSVVDVLSLEKILNTITAPDCGKEAVELYSSVIAKNIARMEKEKNQTVEDRIVELAGFPKRKELFSKGSFYADDVSDAQGEVLVNRKVLKEYHDHPEKFQTVKDVDDAVRKYKIAYGDIITFAQRKIGESNTRILRADEDGTELENAFRSALIGCSEYKKMKDLDETLQPTARQQIEALQRRIRKNDFDRKNKSDLMIGYEKKRMVAQILGAREALGVRSGVRGGDPKLDRKMNASVYEKAGKYQDDIEKRFTEEEFDELYTLAAKGHGGELQKRYQEILINKAASLDVIPKDHPKSELPSAKLRIEAMQKKLAASRDPVEKRRCLAQIIAARQCAEAKRGDYFGGDDKLLNKVDPRKLSRSLSDVEGYLSRMPEEKVNQLIREAGSGHGGSMMESYQEVNTYRNQYNAIKKQFADKNPNVEKPDLANAYVIGIKYAAKPYDRDKTINEAGVRKAAADMRNTPGFKAFSEDPEVVRLFAEGDMKRLVMKWAEAREKGDPAAENPQENPVIEKQEEKEQNNIVNEGPGPV